MSLKKGRCIKYNFSGANKPFELKPWKKITIMIKFIFYTNPKQHKLNNSIHLKQLY